MAKSDFDIYQHVTNQIIEAMEAGVSPWRKPWSGGEQSGSFPLRANGAPYRGINVLMLWLAAHPTGSTRRIGSPSNRRRSWAHMFARGRSRRRW